MKIGIVNGPNLNLLGKREPEIYGNQSFAEVFEELKKAYPEVELHHYQSNVEGELINQLHAWGFGFQFILLNAGGYSHTSVALADAVAAITTPVIEVHITNIFAREEYRHISLVGKNCKGSISGFGINSYRIALEACLLP